MDVEPRIQFLLEELADSERTPEEVCRDCPELLPQVRRRWRRKLACDAQLDAMFPAQVPGAFSGGMSSTDLLQIAGYELLEVLGRGGMGIVYKARHVRLNRFVALKMLLTGVHASPEARERFLREAGAAAALRHPNIVQVYDMGDKDGQPYFTMEFVEGGSLAGKLAGIPIPPRHAAELLATMAEAIEAAHRSGIVHRDLKPANVLLTTDGIPKISDFGLARRINDDAGLTRIGIMVGTPSYMAPEQAEARSRDVGPAADTYALGAIFYELLTGRPPFRAETGAETLRQVVSQDPVPPSRLNAAVPRDPETICLKCLEKDPKRRYTSAAALAADLHRFERNEPILARPVGPLERGLRWSRRNPTGAALVATALALIGLASGGGVWLVNQRSERRAELRTEVGATVAQAVSFRQGFHFQQARELLEQARRRLQATGLDALRQRVNQARADLDLTEHLDTARIQEAALVEGRYDQAGAEPLYASAFAEAGLGREGDDIEAVASAVRASAVRAEIVAALDDWASITSDRKRREWLLAVAREADPVPDRDRLRQPDLWQDGARLTRVAQELRVAELSPQLATALGRVARASGGDAVALLTAAQACFPQDFWLNFELAYTLYKANRPDEALGYYRAALALRPKAGAVYDGLGTVLQALGRVDEAMGHSQEALRLDPEDAWAQTNLALALRAKGRLDEAINYLQQALSIDPKSAVLHSNLGLILRDKRRLDEAIDHCQQALRIEPESYLFHYNLGIVLRDKGRLDEAIDQFQQALRIEPKSAHVHNLLGLALRDKRLPDEAIGHLLQSLRIDPKSVVVHNNLGMALRDKGRLDEAIDQFQHALRIDPKSALVHNNLGMALRDKGRLDEAIGHLQQAVSIEPKSALVHYDLGLALRDKGRLDEAIGHLQQAVSIEPKSALFRYHLGLALRAKGLLDEAIGHFQQALSIEPKSAWIKDNLGASLYDAARAAVGQAREEARLGEPARAALRQKALDRLRANLELTAGLRNDGKVVGWSLATWQTDPALASVRDPAELAKLPNAEREQWGRLWADVAARLAIDPEEQGRMLAARRDWEQAANCYSRALKRGSRDDGQFWFEYAALLLLSGDRQGYVKACDSMVEKCGKDSNLRSYHVARACTLALDALPDTSRPGGLAKKELQDFAGQSWSLTEQGALAYRAGRSEESLHLFEQSLEASSKLGHALVNWLWLALANQRLGRADVAQRWLDKAQASLDQHGDGIAPRAEEESGLHLHDWLEAHVLRREAEALIQSKGPRRSTENRRRGAPQK